MFQEQSQSKRLKLEHSLFDNKKRFDIFISFPGKQRLDCIVPEYTETTIGHFVDNHLVSSLKDMWKNRGYYGEIVIFHHSDSIHGSLDNAIFGGISALQVGSLINMSTFFFFRIECEKKENAFKS